MSVVIDMEMPENCLECKLADRYHHDECPIYAICKSDYVDKRFEKCPIKAELPKKHGRLIDVEPLCNDLLKRWSVADAQKEELVQEVMADVVTPIVVMQPTVIEAEGEA